MPIKSLFKFSLILILSGCVDSEMKEQEADSNHPLDIASQRMNAMPQYCHETNFDMKKCSNELAEQIDKEIIELTKDSEVFSLEHFRQFAFAAIDQEYPCHDFVQREEPTDDRVFDNQGNCLRQLNYGSGETYFKNMTYIRSGEEYKEIVRSGEEYKDIDFDGDDELIVLFRKRGNRHYKEYKAYNIDGGELVLHYREDAVFDSETKTVINQWSSNACTHEIETYQAINNTLEMVRLEFSDYEPDGYGCILRIYESSSDSENKTLQDLDDEMLRMTGEKRYGMVGANLVLIYTSSLADGTL